MLFFLFCWHVKLKLAHICLRWKKVFGEAAQCYGLLKLYLNGNDNVNVTICHVSYTILTSIDCLAFKIIIN